MKNVCRKLAQFMLALLIMVGAYSTQMRVSAANEAVNVSIVPSSTAVASGELFYYTVTLGFSGTTVNYSDMDVIIDLPEGISNIVSLPNINGVSGTYDVLSRKVVYHFDTVNSGAVYDITIGVSFKDFLTPNNTSEQAQVTVQGTATDSGSGVSTNINQSKTADAVVVGATPYQEIRKSTMNNKIIVGEVFPYYITYKSHDNSTSQGHLKWETITIVDTLPAGLEFQSATLGGVYDAGTHSVSWHFVGTEDSSAYPYKNMVVFVKVTDSSLAGSDITNRVSVSSVALGESTPHILASEVTLPVVGAGLGDPSTKIGINKVADKAKYGLDADISFSITGLSNNTDVTLEDYTIIDRNWSPELALKKIYLSGVRGMLPSSTYYLDYTVDDQSVADNMVTWINAASYTTNAAGDDLSAKTIAVADLGLPTGTQVTGIRVRLGNVPTGFSFADNANGNQRIRLTYAVSDASFTGGEVENTAKAKFVYNNTVIDSEKTATTLIEGESSPTIGVEKTVANLGPFLPNGYIDYKISAFVSSGGGVGAQDFVVSDLLPVGVTYVTGSLSVSPTAMAPDRIEIIDDYNGSGRQLIRMIYSDEVDMGTAIYYNFRTLVANEAGYGTITNTAYASASNLTDPSVLNYNYQTDVNDVNGNGSVDDYVVYADVQSTIEVATKITSEKLVRGELDKDPSNPNAGFSKYPGVATTTPGGQIEYQLKVTNDSNIAVKDVVVMDILPKRGDIGVVDHSARLSEWSPYLSDELEAPSNTTIYYTTAENPSRSELVGVSDPVGAEDPMWSETPPADLTQITALLFKIDVQMEPGESRVFEWKMRAPIGAPTSGEVAWNSFAFSATNTVTGNSISATEPNKVGTKIQPNPKSSLGDFVWLDVNNNGIQDVGESGVNGVRVHLLDISDNILDTTLTGDNFDGAPGYYGFVNLDAGTYKVEFVLPDGYVFTVPAAGGDSALDSDVILDGKTNMIVLGIGEDNQDIDAGLIVKLPEEPKEETTDNNTSDNNQTEPNTELPVTGANQYEFAIVGGSFILGGITIALMKRRK
ncbi:SdrD B-like domain-containing protein [Culicoidibacter larvae]|uniref:Gram-positive cocci surface proteins LPxTG domain-containing protein n=1 Tax=Culicoidibacter larvae TaxID=2579976 RepID=A0A5R8QIY5_9FIRM|nr:SdrD B-like domain-containing protein [Culicoidibacter larvae]TLG77217.1 hypothetical protein FEZ08_00960 [Culicoidibacter larvae]